jgi:uncharacterized protein YgiB involved in biofilm formation
MKRSRTVALTLMMGTASTLSACGDAPPDQLAFTGGNALQQCIDSGAGAAACQTAFDAALAQHRESAPKFETQPVCLDATDSECEAVGTYRQDGSYTSFWVPALGGFLLARALDRDNDRYYTYIGGSNYRSSPLYRSRTSTDGYRVLSDYGSLKSGTALSTKPSVALPPPNVKTTTIARGGFGKGGGFFSRGG